MNQITSFAKGVYFIYAPNQNKVKIGRSVDIEKRYLQLRTGFMDKGTLLLGILTENEVELEKKLHNKFSHLRDNGEWFLMTKELDDFILNCNIKYDNVKLYGDLNKIRNKLSYRSLGMYKLVLHIKQMPNKYLIPLLLFGVGLILAWYNYKFELTGQENNILKYLSYLFFIFFPIMTPIMARNIISYQSLLVGILFFSLLFVTLLLELSNLLFDINTFFLEISRVIILSLFFPFIKYISLIVLAKKNDEYLIRKAKNEFKNSLNESSLKDKKEVLINKRKKINKLRKYTVYIMAVLAYVFFNVYLIFISKSSKESILFTILIMDAAAILWFIMFVMYIKNYSGKFVLSSNNRINIIPIALTIAFFSLIFLFNEFTLFWNLVSIVVIGTLPVSIIFLITMYPKRKIEIRIEEINDKLEK